MKFTIQTEGLTKEPNSAIILGISNRNELSPMGQQLDKLTKGYISKVLKKGELEQKPGETLLLLHLPNTQIEHVLLVSSGKDLKNTQRDYRKMVVNSFKVLQNTTATRILSFLPELEVEDADLQWKVRQIVEGCEDTFYRFDQFKSVKSPNYNLKEVSIYIPEKKLLSDCTTTIKQAQIIAEGVKLTKDIANLPSNICNPSYLADRARELAKNYKNISTKVLEEKDMEKLGMGAFLSVAKGSAEDAKLVCMEYKGNGSKNPYTVALVGKGITFDTGGISLKPGDSMVGMKYDMCGAATVLGTMKAVAELKLPIRLIGILATAENMPSGQASKPEDIVTTMSGQTVEIMNTDAEGRLVLCDALTYCERYKPDAVIDIATLTGAVVIALGHHATGLLANNQTLASELLTAGEQTYDRAWQLPLWDDYQEQLRSPFADMSNVGGRPGGTITAACFLSRFAKKFNWAHLDVAGTAAMMGSGPNRYATGRPVPLLTQYLINCSEKQ